MKENKSPQHLLQTLEGTAMLSEQWPPPHRQLGPDGLSCFAELRETFGTFVCKALEHKNTDKGTQLGPFYIRNTKIIWRNLEDDTILSGTLKRRSIREAG